MHYGKHRIHSMKCLKTTLLTNPASKMYDVKQIVFL